MSSNAQTELRSKSLVLIFAFERSFENPTATRPTDTAKIRFTKGQSQDNAGFVIVISPIIA